MAGSPEIAARKELQICCNPWKVPSNEETETDLIESISIQVRSKLSNHSG